MYSFVAKLLFMSKHTTIGEVMTQNVIVANVNNKFSQFLEFFNIYRVQHMPVTLGNELVGILSTNDLLSFISANLFSGAPIDFASLDQKFNVYDAMTKNPVTIKPEDSIEDAFSILSHGKFQALPVVKEKILVGIITNKDLVRLYPTLLS